MENLELNKLSDEQIEKEFNLLKEKKDVTPEEKEKLATIKEERTTRYQKRLDKLTWEKKNESEKAKKLEEQLEAQRKELEEIKSKQSKESKPIIVEEYVEYSGKKFYTDKSLMSMVESKELSPEQAYAHQQQRLKAEIKDEMQKESQQKDQINKNAKIWEDDKAAVLKEYPEFSPKHPNHNPEDPLFKLASEIYNDDFIVEGQVVNPRALSLSIKRAKQILKTTDTRPNVSDEQTIRRPGSSASSGQEPVTLTQTEQDTAVRLYQSVINPVTNKFYTEQEAINKALKVKKARGR